MQDNTTEIIILDPAHPDPAIIERAAHLLRTGQLVVFPTETVYGLGADSLQPTAVKSIFAAKERPYSDPLIVHIAAETELEQITTFVPSTARQLAQSFWPGPLTLILPASNRVPSLVTSGLATVAVRLPRHPIALALIRALHSPIAAPSANRFMHISPTTAQHALADLDGRVPLILDGGPCEVGVESTILDLSVDPPIILRPGGVSLEMLRTVVPEVRPPAKPVSPPPTSEQSDIAQKAPGQLQKHYAPTVPTILYKGSDEHIHSAMLSELQRRRARNQQVGLLLAEEDLAAFADSGARLYVLGSLNQPEHIASRLFAGLRTLEEAGVEVILCRGFDETGIGLAISDRLLKAASGRVIILPDYA
jgi:L-threonylcarbamoyladenylate synthase